MSYVTIAPPRRLLTEDAQPAASGAWDAPVVGLFHEALRRHLEEVAETDAIRHAWSLALQGLHLRWGDRVVDVGCGTGAFLPALGAAVGPSGAVIGIDHAHAFLADARASFAAARPGSRLSLIEGDAHCLPLASASVDAAHTERVLMHLRDPDRALAELRRVVKPGGWVVAVEPDLAGWRIDDQDPDAVGAIMRGFYSAIRNPMMGLEVARRMAARGFVQIEAHAVTEIERDLPADVFAHYRHAAETAVERGWLTRDRAEKTLCRLRAAADAGGFTSYSSLFVVAGRVPQEKV